MNSSAIAISVSPSPSTNAKGKGGKDSAADDDAKAFSISLEVAQGEVGGETETTSITIQGVTSETDGADDGSSDGDSDVTIEIETVVFSGDDLARNLTASTIYGGGSVTVTEDGAFGVEGPVTGEAEVQLEIGETLTFELPPSEGEVIGGQVTITNLYSDDGTTEGALIFAYDAEDNQLACYAAFGNETGTVTVEIDVPFARLDFKAIDNESLAIVTNSNFGVSDVSAMFASVVDGMAEDASQLIDDILAKTGLHIPGLVDLGHLGTIHYEVSRVSANHVATIDALSSTRVGHDRGEDRQPELPFDMDRGGWDRGRWQAGF